MLLQRLKEYAQRVGIPPLGYAKASIRYIIQIDTAGGFVALIDTATPENKRGESFIVPDYGSRTSQKAFPIPFADNATYTLGIPIPSKNGKNTAFRHEEYCGLIVACADATKEPSVQAIAKYLASLKPENLSLPEDFDPEAKITFEVGGIMVATLVQTWWSEHIYAKLLEKRLLECMVCGIPCHPLIIWPTQIHGLPGGQTTGVAVVSGQVESAESYGLMRASYAPICALCAHEIATALNMLLRQPETHTIIGDRVYVYWSDDNDEFSLKGLMEAQPNEIDNLLSSLWRGNLKLSTCHIYITILGANAARLVVHDWIDMTLEHIQQNLQRYFRFMCIVDKMGERRYFPLWQLTQVGGYGSEQALIQCALNGGKLPMGMLYHVLWQIYKSPVSLAHVALIKMILLSWEERPMEEQLIELDLDSTDQAYLCGRLFRVLEAIEWQSQGEIIAGCKIYFKTASARPIGAFSILIPRARYHLKKLKRDRFGAYWGLNRQFCELLEHFGETFPEHLNPRESGRFICGYHHQQAADRKAATLAKEKKESEGKE